MSSNLANITKILAATGEALDTSQRSSAAWHTTPKLCTKTAAEVDLIRARRLASSKTQRNAITKRIFRLRKKHLEDQAKQEMAKYFENSTGTRGSACFRKIRRSTATPIAQLGPPKQIPGQGLHNIPAAKGPMEISNMFADYFCHLYAHEDFIIPEWVQDKFDGAQLYQLAMDIFDPEKPIEISSQMKTGTACSEDRVSIEMLRALDRDFFEVLSLAFRKRFLGLDCDLTLWNEIVVTLVPKKAMPDSVNDFRPISVMPVLCKIYFKALGSEVAACTEGLLCQHIFAYRKCYSTTDQLFAIRQLIEKTNEWDMSLVYARTDIHKAYDLLDHAFVHKVLGHCGVPDAVSHAILREWLNMKSGYKWGKIISNAVPRKRGIPQGDPISPLIFNLCINFIIDPLLRVWQDRKFGPRIDLPDGDPRLYLPVLNFADDFILFVRNPDQLQTMLSDLDMTLRRAGLHLDNSKTVWSHNLAMRFPETTEALQNMKAIKAHV